MKKLYISPFLISIVVFCAVLFVTCKKSATNYSNDWTLDHGTGYVPSTASAYASVPKAQLLSSSGTMPSSFFLEIPTVVADQGKEGICTSFACTNTLSIQEHSLSKTAYLNSGDNYSPSFLYDQVHVGTDCNSGSSFTANLEVMQRVGTCLWTDRIYNDNYCNSLITSQQLSSAAAHKIVSYTKIDPINVTTIKQSIYNSKTPVMISFQIDDNFGRSVPSYIWNSFGDKSYGWHCAVLYGFDDNKGAFKMLNSWGSQWGDNGTIWVSYNFIENGSSGVYGRIFREAYVIQTGSNPGPIPNPSPTNWTCGQPFTDPRDGSIYNTISINGRCWLAENLRYTGGNVIGKNYNNSASDYATHGRLYSSQEVSTGNIAPPGWHVPSVDDFMVLANYVNSNFTNHGGALKSTSSLWSSPNTGAANNTGFSGLPGGAYYNGNFFDNGHILYLWTSNAQGGGTNAFVLQYDSNSFGAGYFNAGYYCSVRCVKD